MVPNPDARTYRDLVDELAYKLGVVLDGRNDAQISSAIRNAYLILANKRAWTFSWKEFRILFNAAFTDGTIQYTQATRQLVLSGATWPSWVNDYSRVRVGTVNSQVASVVNSTTLILDPVANFGQDIAAGTTYVIYQNLFPLPGDFKAMGMPRGEQNWYASLYVTPEDWLAMERSYGGTTSGGIPLAWTVLGDWNTSNGFMLAVWPWPDQVQTYDFIYQAAFRPLFFNGVGSNCRQGTVAGTGGSPAIVGTGTVWTANMAGSVIRFGSTVKVPTGQEGLNPYVEQHIIASVTDATHLTLADNLTTTCAGVGYVVSDPLNMPESMFPALLRRAELELADLKDRGKYAEQEARWRRAYLEAGEADQRQLSQKYAGISEMPARMPLRLMPYSFGSAG